jgi:hypothetical protein
VIGNVVLVGLGAIVDAGIADAEIDGNFDDTEFEAVVADTGFEDIVVETAALVATAFNPHWTRCASPIDCPEIAWQTTSKAVSAPKSSFAVASSTPGTICGVEIRGPKPTIPL